MVMKPEPIFAAVEDLRSESRKTSNTKHRTSNAEQSGIENREPKVILMSPTGRRFDQSLATELSHESHLVIVCGHYEGVDHRVVEHLIDEEISIGDYVLTNGAIAAVVLVDAIVRLIPGSSVTNNPPTTTFFAKDCWRDRNTRARRNFAAGNSGNLVERKSRPELQHGEKSNRKNGRAKTGRICCANKKSVIPGASEGPDAACFDHARSVV